MIEYDKNGNAVMVKELKHGNIKTLELDAFITKKCLTNTAMLLSAPLYVVVYFSIVDFGAWSFFVVPVCELAKKNFTDAGHDTRGEKMHERQYVKFIAAHRKERLSEAELSKFDDNILAFVAPDIQ